MFGKFVTGAARLSACMSDLGQSVEAHAGARPSEKQHTRQDLVLKVKKIKQDNTLFSMTASDVQTKLQDDPLPEWHNIPFRKIRDALTIANRLIKKEPSADQKAEAVVEGVHKSWICEVQRPTQEQLNLLADLTRDNSVKTCVHDLTATVGNKLISHFTFKQGKRFKNLFKSVSACTRTKRKLCSG